MNALTPRSYGNTARGPNCTVRGLPLTLNQLAVVRRGQAPESDGGVSGRSEPVPLRDGEAPSRPAPCDRQMNGSAEVTVARSPVFGRCMQPPTSDPNPFELRVKRGAGHQHRRGK